MRVKYALRRRRRAQSYYSCGSAQTRCRRISTERHFYAHKIKKKVTTPFFLRVKARRIFIHINWRHPYLWEQTFYEKVLRRLQVPVHNALEQCLPTRNGRTCKRRSLGGIFFSSGKQHEKFLPFHSRGWGPVGIWRRFIGLFIDTAADFMYCIHHMNAFEGDEVVFHGKERWSGRLWGGDTIVVARGGRASPRNWMCW